MRVTAQEVKLILTDTHNLSNIQIEATIATATLIIDDYVGSFSDEKLVQAEKYLTAHYCAITDKTLNIYKEKDDKEVEAQYNFMTGMGILGTPFGQVANNLLGGALAESDKQPTCLVSIGTC